MNKKVLVGLSGGVDSAVCAFVLKEQGYDVSAATMLLHRSESSKKDIEDAKAICKKLNIVHHVLDFCEEFKQDVVDYFCDEYSNGRTPNPCIVCNEKIKFGKMLDFALEHGFDYIATGHYAHIEYNKKTSRWLLRESAQKKDQSYFLYRLSQHQLKHTLMPLVNFSKEEVRKIAYDAKLPVASKSDSQEICFITDNDYKKFLKNQTNFEERRGFFIDETKKILGKHKGIANYTIGQRKGLGISSDKPLFVSKIDTTNNNITLSSKEGLYSNSLIAENLNWIAIEKLNHPINVLAKIRFRNKKESASIVPVDDFTVKVNFFEPVLSVAPGQSVVFYDGDLILGGGIIKS